MMVRALHPEWQEMAREEVLQVCGQKEPNFEALTLLKIVNMILHEVSRLYPPVISLCQHTYKDTGIGNIHLPAGVDLALPMLLIHHDPEPWGDDVEEFRPERFLGGVSRASKEQLALFPLDGASEPSYIHAPHTVIILQPQHGAQIIIHQL